MSDVNLGKLTDELYHLLKDLDSTSRKKVVSAVLMLCGDAEKLPFSEDSSISPSASGPSMMRQTSFSEREDISAKEFLKEKQPSSNVDKVACLAYYLTHYSETPHFKTVDISKLNTEAAQAKFSNATQSLKDAIRKGLVVTAGRRGFNQLSAVGEDYVNALPSQQEAKAVLASQRRTVRKRSNSKKSA